MHVATNCPRLRVCELGAFFDKDFSEGELQEFRTRFPAIELTVEG